MVYEIKNENILTKKLRLSAINEIPNSVKAGITGEFLGRIGMGLIGIYFIFYLIALNGSLQYYPLFLFSMLVSSLLGSSLSGYLGSKYSVSILLRKVSIFSPLLMLLIPIAVNSIMGLLVLYFILGFIISFLNPLFSTHIINETNQNSRDLSYSFYKGSSILGQNFAGFVGGLILIVIFLNIVNLTSLKFILCLAFLLLSFQIGLLYFIRSKETTNQSIHSYSPEESTDKKIQLRANNPSDTINFNKFTPYLMLLVIILVSFGVGQSYSYLALFLNQSYEINLSTISIVLAGIGLFTGFTTFTTSYFTKRIKKNKFLGISNLLIGISYFIVFIYPPLVLLVIFLFIEELTASISSPIANIILLTSVSQRKRNLFSSVGILFTLFSELLGSIIAVLLIDQTGIFYNFLLCGFAFFLSGLIMSFLIKEKENFQNFDI